MLEPLPPSSLSFTLDFRSYRSLHTEESLPAILEVPNLSQGTGFHSTLACPLTKYIPPHPQALPPIFHRPAPQASANNFHPSHLTQPVRRIRRGECVCTSTVEDGLRPHAVPVCEVKTDAALKTLQVNQTAAEVGFEDDRWCIDDDLQFDHTMVPAASTTSHVSAYRFKREQ
jgi:hypothetical protein